MKRKWYVVVIIMRRPAEEKVRVRKVGNFRSLDLTCRKRSCGSSVQTKASGNVGQQLWKRWCEYIYLGFSDVSVASGALPGCFDGANTFHPSGAFGPSFIIHDALRISRTARRYVRRNFQNATLIPS